MQAFKAIVSPCLAISLLTLAAGLDWEWKKLQPSGVAPTATYRHAAVLDKPGLAMLVFGGRADTWALQGDLHSYDLQANAWSLLLPTGTAPSKRQGPSMVFDDEARTVLLFGGAGYGGVTNDLYRYEVQANAWSSLSPAGTAPTPRTGHTAVFDATTRTMLVFGGCNITLFNDLYSYDVQTAAWRALSPTGSVPSKRCYSSAVLDTASRNMLVFGGGGSFAEILDDLHSYDVQANAWSVLSPSGSAPLARLSHSTVWVSGSRTMLVFGGAGNGTSNIGDLLGYDVQANAWSALSPSGTPPGALSHHTAVLDTLLGTMLIYGGSRAGGAANDLYALEMGTSTVTTSSATTVKDTGTTIVCGPGSELNSEGDSCQACAPGRVAAGHDSQAGSSACLPILSHVVANLAVPVLSTSHVWSSVVRLRLGLAVLPQAVFNVVGLSYAVDLAATADALSTESACAAKWEISEGTASVQLDYAELSDPCSTIITSTEKRIRRDGILGIHLIKEDSFGSEVVFRWTQGLTLTFSLRTDVIAVTRLLGLGALAFQVGAFPSTLRLFVSDSFTTVRLAPLLLLDEAVLVEHALSDAEGVVSMTLVMAFLSRSSNISDLEAVEDNLTLALQHHEGGVGFLRYSFSAKPCQSCYLHSLSKVTYSIDGRGSNESFAVQSLYLEVTAPDDFPDVFLGPATALGVSAAVALVTGVVVGLLGYRLKLRKSGAPSMQAFFVLGFGDCLSGILVLVVAGEDLQFSDDGGAVFAALFTCVGVSVFLFSFEASFWACWGQRFSEAQKKTTHSMLACALLATEDFQTGLCAFATASHTSRGNGLPASLLFAMLKAAVFTVVKVAEVTGGWDLCEPAAPVPAPEPAAPEATLAEARQRFERVSL